MIFLDSISIFLDYILIFLHTGKYLVKRMVNDPDLADHHAEFADVLAELEMKLPLNWSTSTHHLLLHMAEVFALLGMFWAHNNLPTERLHVKLKNLARGYKHMMRSFGRHYDLFDATQTEWRLEDTPWITKPPASSLASVRDVPTNQGVVVAKGKSRLGTLTRAEMEQVKNLWATECKGFDALKDRYAKEAAAHEKAARKRKRSTIPPEPFPRFRNWTPRRNVLSIEQQRWTQMSKSIQVF
jgi:hypothetical protein